MSEDKTDLKARNEQAYVHAPGSEAPFDMDNKTEQPYMMLTEASI